MDAFQREVIERLARIETKMEELSSLPARVTSLEKGESRRNTLIGALAAVLSPAGLAALWLALHGRNT